MAYTVQFNVDVEGTTIPGEQRREETFRSRRNLPVLGGGQECTLCVRGEDLVLGCPDAGKVAPLSARGGAEECNGISAAASACTVPKYRGMRAHAAFLFLPTG